MTELRSIEWTPEEIAESCWLAADILRGHWTQSTWYAPAVEEDGTRTVRFCLEGGLAVALGLDARLMQHSPEYRKVLASCPVRLAVQETIRLDGNTSYIPGWNDEGGRTEEQVLDILERTAKRVLGVPRDDE